MSRRVISTVSFTLFVAWLLSFAYEGQILYALYHQYSIEASYQIAAAILFHAVGLFLCGYFVKSLSAARNCLLLSTAVCLLGSCLFFFAPSIIWTVSLYTVAFFAGLWNAAWGFFYKSCSLPKERLGTAAAAIASSTTLMVGLNLAAIHLRPWIGLLLSIISLAGSFYFCMRLPKTDQSSQANTQSAIGVRLSIKKSLILLCLFILTVTVASGLMFQSVNPAFSHLTLLTSIYWAVPYIAAFIVVARLPRTINREYVLYAAVAMIGLGFLAFLILDHSAISYLIVNTLLLGAFGVTDLFWWSVLGEMLDYQNNPARILGFGLSVNVAGVLIGEGLSHVFSRQSAGNAPTIISLSAVCVAIIVLPVLLKSLSNSLKSISFINALESMPNKAKEAVVDKMLNIADLTVREREITALLLRGYTYRLIATELFISESTVKTHIQNIYFKYDVHNKTELIQKLSPKT